MVTVLADFEDEAVAAEVSAVANALPADCAARTVGIPARGQRSLALTVGATRPNASAAFDLRFRQATRLAQVDRVATHCWLRRGQVELAFRLRDGRGRVFETARRLVDQHYRWVRVAAGLGPAAPAGPIELLGLHVYARGLRRQTVFVDDLEVEHRVTAPEVIRGAFRFASPTRIYAPGSRVAGALLLENRSRRHPVRVSVRLTWLGPAGAEPRPQRAGAYLPPGGADFRSRKLIDFAQRVEQPGLYQLAAGVWSAGWRAESVFRTTVAVTPPAGTLPRGRSVFFGVHTALWGEPLDDQLLEIRLARRIGVNLLALDVPWRLIEPDPGRYDFAALRRLVDAISGRDMAPLLVLRDAPEWLAAGGRARRLDGLLRACARYFGRQVAYYQVTLEALGLASPYQQERLVAELQAHVARINPEARILSAPYRLGGPARQAGRPILAGGPAGPYATFRSGSDPPPPDADLPRQPCGFWLHYARPLPGPGTACDAEAVLRRYVAAASAGANALVWFELRDPRSEPGRVRPARGLVTRGFAPKSALLGYATAAGMLSGLRYAGPVFGAPPALDSALFIGSNRQVAVLLPRANRVHPAVVAPVRGVPGKLEVLDFQRRPQELLGSGLPPLAAWLERPFFVTLDLDSAQPEPQLALARPWLEVGAPLFCGSDTSFALELTAPCDLGRGSFLQIVLPPDAPFESSFSARALHAALGQRLRYEVALRPRPGRSFDRGRLTIRVSLGGRQVSVPVEVRPLTDVRPLADGATVLEAAYRLGALLAADPDGASATGAVHAAYEGRRLHVAVALSARDSRSGAGPASGPGADRGRLLLGLGVAGQAEHVELELVGSANGVELRPVYGTRPERLAGWRAGRQAGEDAGQCVYHLVVPARSFGLDRWGAGQRLLASVRYRDDRGRCVPGQRTGGPSWGGGLDGGRATTDFRWLRLRAPAGG